MPICINPRTSLATNSFSRVELPRTSANNRKNPQNYPPMSVACRSGNVEWLREEINKCKADVYKDYPSEGLTCLSPLICIAVREGHLEILKLLLQNGVDVNARDNEGNSALLLASGFGRDDIVEFLLDHGADIYMTNCNNETPLHIAAYFGHKTIVNRLLDYDIDVNHLSNQGYGFTPLYYATNYGYTEIAESLIKCGAKINIYCGIRGTTPLCSATLQGNLAMVELLLKSGANTNMHDKYNLHPIEIACTNGYAEIVQLLLHNGADISEDIYRECIQVTEYKYRDIGDIIKTCSKNRIKLAQQNTPERKNKYQEAPIVSACRNGNVEWFREITEYQPYAIYSTHKTGKSIDVKHKKTLLYTACKYGHEQIVDLLINMGVDVNMCLSAKRNPLYIASSKGYHKIVEKLLQKGIDIKEIDNCIAAADKNKHYITVNILKIAKENSEKEKKFPDNPERYAFDNLAFVKG